MKQKRYNYFTRAKKQLLKIISYEGKYFCKTFLYTRMSMQNQWGKPVVGMGPFWPQENILNNF